MLYSCDCIVHQRAPLAETKETKRWNSTRQYVSKQNTKEQAHPVRITVNDCSVKPAEGVRSDDHLTKLENREIAIYVAFKLPS